jgi:integrase
MRNPHDTIFSVVSEHDISGDLKGALAPVVTEHFAAICEPKRVGELLRAIDGYVGHSGALYALKLAPFVFVRPGELRGAKWAEFDLDESEWRIAGERMKTGQAAYCPAIEAGGRDTAGTQKNDGGWRSFVSRPAHTVPTNQ